MAIDKEFFEGYQGEITRTQISKLRIMLIGKQRTELKPHGRCRLYNTPQLLDQKVSDAKLIFCAVLCSILV